MRIREGGKWNERACTKEVVGGRDVIASLVPVIRKTQERPMSQEDRNECEEKNGTRGGENLKRRKIRARRSGQAHRRECLVNGAARHRHGVLRLKRDSTEGLFILSEVLAKHVPQSFGLLWAQVHAMVVFDVDLVGRVLVSDAEVEKEIPHADAHLNAVGVAFAIVRGFTQVNFWLRMRGIHGAYRL